MLFLILVSFNVFLLTSSLWIDHKLSVFSSLEELPVLELDSLQSILRSTILFFMVLMALEQAIASLQWRVLNRGSRMVAIESISKNSTLPNRDFKFCNKLFFYSEERSLPTSTTSIFF